MSQRGRITAFSANDDNPLDLSNPPTGGTAVTRPETGAPVDRYAFYLRGEMPPGWAPNIWENYCRMVAPLEGPPPPSLAYMKRSPQ